MRLKICLLIISFFVFSSVLAAQTDEFETAQTSQTIKIIEFGLTGDCEKGAIVDSLFIELNNIPNATGYIILYRGTEDLPSRQSDRFLQTQFDWIKKSMMFRKYNTERITLIDGGFRKSDKFLGEVWLVPQGGIIPQPTETVEKPKLPKNKAYLVDNRKHNSIIYFASFAYQESERLSKESEETDAVEDFTEVEEVFIPQEPDLENIETEEVEIDESNELYWDFSNYFGDTLEADQSLRGTIIYYADSENYDLKKSHELMNDFLENYKKKNNVDLSRIRLVYGGYRKDMDIEFWIVPKGAKEPQPKPEVKKIEVEK